MMTMERSPARPTPVTLLSLVSDGPPVRVSDLARITGFTSHKIIDDIYRRELVPQNAPRRNDPYLIEREEARRYLRALGWRI